MLVAERMHGGTDRKWRHQAIQLGPKIVGQNRPIVRDIGVKKLARFAKLLEVDLVAQRRQIVEHDRELVHFQAIVNLDENLILTEAGNQANFDGPIVGPLGHGMAVGEGGRAQDSGQG